MRPIMSEAASRGQLVFRERAFIDAEAVPNRW
jgi:hypothetical protein